MRNFQLLLLFFCLISRTITRPSLDQRNANSEQVDKREAEEVEYEIEDNSADDSFQEDEGASLNEQDSRDADPGPAEEQGRDEATRVQQLNNLNEEKYMPRTIAEERVNKPSNDREMYLQRNKEEKLDEDVSSNNDPSLQKRRQSNKYIESSELIDSPDNTQHFNKVNRMLNDVRDNELDKRTVDTRRMPLDDSETLFDNQRMQHNVDKSEHLENADSGEQSRHLIQYYNNLQSDHKSMLRENNYGLPQYLINRDRRQADPTDELVFTSTSTEKEPLLSETANEDDEAAIKRHIRKLSGEELEELLNSLSDEKKALLNKIMDSNHNNYDTLNKREITKKAEAVEENNYIDGGLSDLSKEQAVSSSIDGNTESAISENSKQEGQTESSEPQEAKVPETTKSEIVENKAEVVDSVDGVTNSVKLNANEDNKNIISSNLQLGKSESKREAIPDYFNNQDEIDDTEPSDNYQNIKDSEDDSFNAQDRSVMSPDDDLSQLIDDEAQIHQEFKREALADNQADFDDSIRSLEESFPKSECDESDQYVESNMAPLIRVKRKDEIQKRAAGQLSDSKVAFVPYKAENDDEDNDEGNEFDDDGFYDRTANYAKSNLNNPDYSLAPFAFENFAKKPKQYLSDKERAKQSRSSLENKLASDSRSLGSDTDSVLSGVEGVDDNLMYSSGTRNRRTLEDNLEQLAEENGRSFGSTPGAEEVKPPENRINIPHYQESEAFGALPRSYEGELGRYKRIRRVKPSPGVTDADE